MENAEDMFELGNICIAKYQINGEQFKEGRFLIYNIKRQIRFFGLIVLKDVDFRYNTTSIFKRLTIGRFVKLNKVYQIYPMRKTGEKLDALEFEGIQRRADELNADIDIFKLLENQYTIKREAPKEIKGIVFAGKTSPK